MMRRIPLITFALLCGCSKPLVPPVRFANAPVVAAVDDRRDVPNKPSERTFIHSLYHYDGIVHRRLERAFELPRMRRALGVNALDEVPDSTWFTNRIGIRDLTLDQLRTGPARVGSPETHMPWTIRSSKVGGTELGLIISDARGKKFLLKFDREGYAEQETATHVIVGKLLWASGFDVTEDHVVYFHGKDLVLPPGAMIKDEFGNKRPLDRVELDRMLAQVETDQDGRIRAMASLWLDGKPLGGHPAEGVRADDPNDRIPHQLRRDLRGAYAIFSWLDHVDVQEGNFLDMWVKDGDRHYVKHYMIDFGKSLGVMNTTGKDRRHGHEYVVDIAAMLRSLFTIGIEQRSWEGRTRPALRGVGLFDVADFDPGEWKPDSPAYVPFLVADRIDKFWGAKILIRFTREQIHAVVESARLTDPRATEYVTDTLVARQRAVARYWFERVNPLDHFTVTNKPTGVELCFDDLMLVYRLGGEATRYDVTTHDRDTRVIGASAMGPDAAGHACIPVRLASSPDGYTIIRIETSRGDFDQETFVYVAREPSTNTPRVIGIWRP
jgi:hypothetical protein